MRCRTQLNKTSQSKRAVLFVPGLSSPYDERYAPTYTALLEEAKKQDYGHYKIVLMPGQLGSAGNQAGTLSLSTAREKLEQEVRAISGDDFPALRIVAFSFGCTVALSLLGSDDGTRVRESILIGPIPLWVSWQAFRQGIGRKYLGESTHMMDDKAFFDDLVPVESLFAEAHSSLVIAAGTNDEYCAPSYLGYLERFSNEKKLPGARFVPIPGCGHTPKPDKPGWSEFVEIALGPISNR